MTPSGWVLLTEEQQAAARAAANLITDVELQFVMMLFGEGKQGAVISNIHPNNAIELIEAALKAAKTKMVLDEELPGTLQ